MEVNQQAIAAMQAVTISRQYGSGGGEIAARLARKLGWQLIDHAIVEKTASELGVYETDVSRYDEEHVEGALSRILNGIRNFTTGAFIPPTASGPVFPPAVPVATSRPPAANERAGIPQRIADEAPTLDQGRSPRSRRKRARRHAPQPNRGAWPCRAGEETFDPTASPAAWQRFPPRPWSSRAIPVGSRREPLGSDLRCRLRHDHAGAGESGPPGSSSSTARPDQRTSTRDRRWDWRQPVVLRDGHRGARPHRARRADGAQAGAKASGVLASRARRALPRRDASHR